MKMNKRKKELDNLKELSKQEKQLLLDEVDDAISTFSASMNYSFALSIIGIIWLMAFNIRSWLVFSIFVFIGFRAILCLIGRAEVLHDRKIIIESMYGTEDRKDDGDDGGRNDDGKGAE